MNIEIPQGIKVEVKGDEVVTTGSLGSNTRKFNDVLLSIKVNGNSIEIGSSIDKRLAKRATGSVNSFAKELKNDMQGVTKHFERHMSIVFAHFPMVVEAKGAEVMIKNMQGERFPRKADIVGTAKVEIKGQDVRIYGTKLDDVAQTAANIRMACRVRKRDSRVFSDGVYHALKEQ